MPATTPNSPSKRKQINKMNKLELTEEVRYHRQNEEEYEKLIKELKQNVKEIKDELNEIRSRGVSSSVRNDFETRLVQTELKQPYSTFSKWPEYQWKNAISMQYTDNVTPGW